ncbi:thiamine-monophosphate kinase [Kineosporia sp. NBRC 101677]|uniref:thiamine-phosphate kinase n=1 Tax=Kineosporia sp. NBRC 101677 TaxID=3032197 RepID=UPI0024A04AA7|nr:thiamine-phosphate kinase [Kineosporia sp. NBRC 101677]GLY16146.1 thiamine-monophosphate kinase [Kineosporia sp. NBRC 101677]
MKLGTSGEQPVDSDPTVGTLGEDPLVAGVIGRYPSAPWLTVGPGDDAAVLDLSGRFPGPLIACTDTIVEGQDFRRDWSTARDIGIKIAAQNFADVAAMGGRPHTLLVSLTTPADVPAAWANELADGLAAECSRAGAVVAGGDVSAGSEIVIVGTALGTLVTPRAVLRSGASVGDVVAVTGGSGRSAAGWALLRAGQGTAADPVLAALLSEHRAPVPPYPAGVEAALAGASAMIDTSDGLVRDALRIATSSQVVLDLSPSALLPSADLLHAASELGLTPADAQEWVLTGGEDHALLACFPPDARIPAQFSVIGEVRAASEAGVWLGGEPFTGEGGWRHWA